MNFRRRWNLMEKKKLLIGVIVGSLRRGAYSRAIANALCELAPEGLELKFVEIGDLPLYNEDLDEDNNVPGPYTRFRGEIAACDGFIFVTPEYNRSIPAALKNALDVGSRPYGQNKWDGKPGAIVCTTPGTLGAFGASVALRQPMSFLNILLLQQPEVYISRVHELLDEKGKLINESTCEFLRSFLLAFEKFAFKIASK